MQIFNTIVDVYITGSNACLTRGFATLCKKVYFYSETK